MEVVFGNFNTFKNKLISFDHLQHQFVSLGAVFLEVLTEVWYDDSLNEIKLQTFIQNLGSNVSAFDELCFLEDSHEERLILR